MLEVMVVVFALALFFDGIDAACVVLAEAKGEARFDRGEEGDPSSGRRTGLGGGQFESGDFLVDFGTVEMLHGNALRLGESVGLLAKGLGELLTMVWGVGTRRESGAGRIRTGRSG